jgi:putative transposase
VNQGIAAGKRPEFTGGGLIRSVGGWSAVKTLRKAGALQKGDERILGDGEFVEEVLSEAKEAFEKNTA